MTFAVRSSTFMKSSMVYPIRRWFSGAGFWVLGSLFRVPGSRFGRLLQLPEHAVQTFGGVPQRFCRSVGIAARSCRAECPASGERPPEPSHECEAIPSTCRILAVVPGITGSISDATTRRASGALIENATRARSSPGFVLRERPWFLCRDVFVRQRDHVPDIAQRHRELKRLADGTLRRAAATSSDASRQRRILMRGARLGDNRLRNTDESSSSLD